MNVLQPVIAESRARRRMDIIQAIRTLARLRDHRTIGRRGDHCASRLQRHWRQEPIFELTQSCTGRIRPGIAECDREIEPVGAVSDGEPPAPNGKNNQKNAPRFDAGPTVPMTGVDLTRIDGVDGFTAMLSERYGYDVAQRQALRVLADQLPHHRRQSHQLQDQGLNRAAAALRLAANTAPMGCSGSLSCAGKPIWERSTEPASSIPCCGTARSTWTLGPNTTKSVSASGVACPSVGRPTGLPAHVRW